MMPFQLMLLLNFLLREVRPLPHKEFKKWPLPLELLLELLLVLMLPLPRPHNISPSRNSMEESLSMFSSKDQVPNANLDKPPRFNIPVLSQLTVKSSIHQFQEDSQSHSLLV